MGYKRVLVTKFGGSEVLQVVDEPMLPIPGPSDVRVKVLASSVCFTDTIIRKGWYFGLKRRPPFSPGYDLVGVVDSLGKKVNRLEVGQIVASLTITGAHSEYLCLPEDSLVIVPAGLAPDQAVSLVLSYVAAYQMLHRIAKVKPYQSILVHGAGGAVGTALLQLGRLFNLKMFGTASSAKQKLITELGATPINYEREDFLMQVRKMSQGGVDIVFDPIGGSSFRRSFAALKQKGILVVYGIYNNVSGERYRIPFDYLNLALWSLLPNRSIASYSISSLRAKQPEWFRDDLIDLFGLLVQGKIRPVIGKYVRMDEVRQAHDLVERAEVHSKIVLIMD